MTTARFGPVLSAFGATFRLMAPAATSIEAVVDGARHQLARADGGWFAGDVHGAAAGSRYRFRIDDQLEVPDPASAFQPEDVADPSQIIDHDAFAWRATNRRDRPWHENALLECHAGTFSPQGTYGGLIEKLHYTADGALNSLSQMTSRQRFQEFPTFTREPGYGISRWSDRTIDSPSILRDVAKFSRNSPTNTRFRGTREDGTIKLAWTRHLLDSRQRLAQVFTFGNYRPITVRGRDADHVFAFSRAYKGMACGVVT